MQQMARKPYIKPQWAMEGLAVKGRENAIFGFETVRPSPPG
jgi:hypothetical protein